jgi:virginiamycin B lyase
MRRLVAPVAILALMAPGVVHAFSSQYFELPKGDYPHDVAVTDDGIAWYAGQKLGIGGRLDPKTGKITRVPLGEKSAPHGVIIGPDGAPWFTDGGQNAIVRVDPVSLTVKVWPLPAERMPYTNLNTAAFDGRGRIWFTGQNGIYGRLDPKSGDMKVWDAPRGRGPYGITGTPNGGIWYVSLAGNYLANVDLETGAATLYEPPTKDQGARRVWSDSKGRLWISEWNSGNVSMYDPAAKTWKQWKLPGEKPRTYSVWVDPDDKVWLADWATSANAVVRFDPVTEKFDSFPSDRPASNVRQMLGRKGEAWAAESGPDRLRVIRYDRGAGLSPPRRTREASAAPSMGSGTSDRTDSNMRGGFGPADPVGFGGLHFNLRHR